MRSAAEALEALLRGDAGWSRNRNFDFYASDEGRRVRRRAGFLRSIARVLADANSGAGTVTVTRTSRSPRPVVVEVVRPGFRRRAFLEEREIALIARLFPASASALARNANEASQPA